MLKDKNFSDRDKKEGKKERDKEIRATLLCVLGRGSKKSELNIYRKGKALIIKKGIPVHHLRQSYCMSSGTFSPMVLLSTPTFPFSAK